MVIYIDNFKVEKSLRRKEPEIIILGKNQVKNRKETHHGIRGTAWTGRVTKPWEPDSVKPGGLIKNTLERTNQKNCHREGWILSQWLQALKHEDPIESLRMHALLNDLCFIYSFIYMDIEVAP